MSRAIVVCFDIQNSPLTLTTSLRENVKRGLVKIRKGLFDTLDLQLKKNSNGIQFPSFKPFVYNHNKAINMEASIQLDKILD